MSGSQESWDRQSGELVRGTQKRTDENTRVNVRSHVCSSVNSLVDLAVRGSLPEVFAGRDKCLFKLARKLHGIEELRSSNLFMLKPIVREWHSRALPEISTEPFDETWAEFVRGWPKVKEPHPMIIERNWIAAEGTPDVSLCKAYDSLSAVRLIKLCAVLGKLEPSGVFYLCCRDAGLIAGVSYKQASNILYMFVVDGVLELVEKGTPSGRASRYRFLAADSTCAEDK